MARSTLLVLGKGLRMIVRRSGVEESHRDLFS